MFPEGVSRTNPVGGDLEARPMRAAHRKTGAGRGPHSERGDERCRTEGRISRPLIRA